eukprot:s1332_g5.t1
MAAPRPLLVLLLCAVAYTAVEQCFSRIASRPLPESETTEVESSPAAAAWLRAARRTAEGKKDSGAHWAAAWESTEAWWLRPVAFSVSGLFTLVAILQQLPGTYLRAVLRRPRGPHGAQAETSEALPVFQERKMTLQMLNELRCSKCLSALQRMELPVFGTAAKWSEKDDGVLVAVNPRNATVLEDWESHVPLLKSGVVDALGENLLNDDVVLHLLRKDDSYELLVRFVKKTAGESHGFGGLSVLSLGCVYLAAQWDTALRATEGELLTVCAASLLLVLLGELAREVTARAQRVKLGSRTFLPCPQLGLLGVFAPPVGASPNKSQQLQLALSAPLTLALASLLLGALDWDPSWTLQLHSTMGLGPLSHLHGECSVTSFVACQGLLMASLALLPQSPDGRSAWSVLLGRENGEKLAETFSYAYPFLGVFAMWGGGAGAAVLSLPFTWQLLLTNLTPSQQPPALEEATEPPMLLKGGSLLLLLGALWVAAQLP